MAATQLTGPDPVAARRAAAAILHESQFRAPSVPRPLHGLLTAIGNALSSVGHAISRVVDSVGSGVGLAPTVVWILLALIVAGVGVVATRRAARRRARSDRSLLAGGSERRETPAELERGADAAERDGRFDDAVRLRFRAGLGRLAERDAIAAVSSTPNAQLARIVDSPDFDALAARFDEIAYGSDAATAGDVESARRRWQTVLGRAGAR